LRFTASSNAFWIVANADLSSGFFDFMSVSTPVAKAHQGCCGPRAVVNRAIDSTVYVKEVLLLLMRQAYPPALVLSIVVVSSLLDREPYIAEPVETGDNHVPRHERTSTDVTIQKKNETLLFEGLLVDMMTPSHATPTPTFLSR
jgi:hypothetical protein